MTLKAFANCINKSDSEYVTLANKFGDTDAELIVRLNNMNIPSPTKADEILKEHRNKTYEGFIDYVKNADIVDPVGLRKALKGLVNVKGSTVSVKVTQRETAANAFSGPIQFKQEQTKFNPEVFQNNAKALEKIRQEMLNQGMKPLFSLVPKGRIPGSWIVFDNDAINEVNKKNIAYFDDRLEATNEIIKAAQEQKARQ